MFSEYSVISAAISRAAWVMPAATSPPCSSIRLVISVKYSSESVEPWISAAWSPRRSRSAGRSPSTPLCANSRPCCSNGCVFSIVGSPAVAWRMCARKVRELTSCASAMNVWLRLAATGLRYTHGVPSRLNVPSPTPSGWVSLSATRLVGAFSSQKVACTSFEPPLIPNSRHTARDSMPCAGCALGVS